MNKSMKKFVNQSIIVGKQISFGQQFNLSNLVPGFSLGVIDSKKNKNGHQNQNGNTLNQTPITANSLITSGGNQQHPLITNKKHQTMHNFSTSSHNSKSNYVTNLSFDQLSQAQQQQQQQQYQQLSSFFPKIRSRQQENDSAIIEEKEQGTSLDTSKNDMRLQSNNDNGFLEGKSNILSQNEQVDDPQSAYDSIALQQQNQQPMQQRTFDYSKSITPSVLINPSPTISTNQQSVKKSFRIKYNSNTRKVAGSQNRFTDLDNTAEDSCDKSVALSGYIGSLERKQIQVNLQLSEYPSTRLRKDTKKVYSHVLSSKEIPKSGESGVFGDHHSASDNQKTKLLEAINVQQVSGQKGAMAKVKSNLQSGNNMFKRNTITKQQPESIRAYNSKNLFQNESDSESYNLESILTNRIKESLSNTSNMNTIRSSNSNNVNLKQRDNLLDIIRGKKGAIESETKDLKSKIQEQKNIIKNCILKKQSNPQQQNPQVIQDLRVKRHISPGKNHFLRTSNGTNQVKDSSNASISFNIPTASQQDQASPVHKQFYIMPNAVQQSGHGIHDSIIVQPLGVFGSSTTNIYQQMKIFNSQLINETRGIAIDMSKASTESGGSANTGVGTRNSLLTGLIATKKEQMELKHELQLLRNHMVATEEAIKEHIQRNDKLSQEALTNYAQILQSQKNLKERLSNNQQANVFNSDQLQNIQVKGESTLNTIKKILQNRIKCNQTMLEAQSKDYLRQMNGDMVQSVNQALDKFREGQSLTKIPNTPKNQVKHNKNSIIYSISPKNVIKMKSPKAKQEPKIQIFHRPSSQLSEHPINQAITKINYIIKLIFKQKQDFNFQNQFTQSSTIQASHTLEEAKLSEIQRMSKFFSIQIPKRFDSKTALREYFQSKDFIVNLKYKMNSLLYNAINESNGMTELLSNIQNQQQQTNIQVNQKFYIGRGNNDAIVRNVIKQRSWWTQHSEEDIGELSFLWTQWKKQKHLDYLAKRGPNAIDRGSKFYSKMEQNKQLSNKKGIFINMRDYYRLIDQDPFEVLPLTFLVKHGLQDPEFERFQQYYQDLITKIQIMESKRSEALAQRQRELQQIKVEKKKQKSTVISLPKLKQKRQSYYSEDVSEEDEEDDEVTEGSGSEDEKIEQDESIKEIKRKYRVPKNVWIIKPGENTNRGNGINVSSNMNEIRNLVQKAHSNETKEKTYIIQKYIDAPLLIHNRKFDFRCYGVMTSVNGHLKGYFYEDAYIRTSCKEYDIDNLSNKYIHLTNDAVQKFSVDYGKYENGNKMSLQDFQKYLKQAFGGYNIDVWRDIMPQIRKLVTDSYRAVYGKIDPGRLHNSFELFGYDFMLDEDFRLYLIEVNTNPCLEISCPLLARIIPEVLDNTFRIVLDPVFPSPDLSNNRKCAINEIPQEIKFTLVFDEDIDGPEILRLQQLKSKDNKLNQIEEEIESDDEEENEDTDAANNNNSSVIATPINEKDFKQ